MCYKMQSLDQFNWVFTKFQKARIHFVTMRRDHFLLNFFFLPHLMFYYVDYRAVGPQKELLRWQFESHQVQWFLPKWPILKDDPFQNPWVFIQAVLYLRIRKFFHFPIISLSESVFYKRGIWSPFEWNIIWRFYLLQPALVLKIIPYLLRFWETCLFVCLWARHVCVISSMPPNHPSCLIP